MDLSRRDALRRAGTVLGAVAAAEVLGNTALAGIADAENAIFGTLHHIGIVVAPNYDGVAAKLGNALGVEWYPPQVETLTLRVENGSVHTYTDRFVLSRSGPPYLELLDPVPGTFFDAVAPYVVAELGYVVGPENLATASDILVDAGMPLVGTIATEPQTGPFGVAWHRVSSGFLIELLAFDPVLSLNG
jgi:hypothetical protein